jgi:hypothetical protein
MWQQEDPEADAGNVGIGIYHFEDRLSKGRCLRQKTRYLFDMTSVISRRLINKAHSEEFVNVMLYLKGHKHEIFHVWLFNEWTISVALICILKPSRKYWAKKECAEIFRFKDQSLALNSAGFESPVWHSLTPCVIPSQGTHAYTCMHDDSFTYAYIYT